MTSLLLVILLSQSGGDSMEDLVRDLGDDLIEVRERAHARLLAAGPPAINALLNARASTDAEVRIRASLVLEVIERAKREGPHDANQLKQLLFLRRNPEAEKRPGSGATQGARFDLAATPFDGGWIVSTEATNYLARRADDGPGKGRLQFDIQGISGADGRNLVVERCGGAARPRCT